MCADIDPREAPDTAGSRPAGTGPDRRALDRQILALALPALGALVVEPLYNITDTAIVGHLGRTSLGGLAVATAVLNVVVYAFGFLAMATTPRIAFLRGRGDQRAAAGAAVTAYWTAAALGVVLAAVVIAAARPLAELAGGHGADLSRAVTYLRVAGCGMPFVLLMLAGNGHLRGLADTRTPFRITVLSNVFNVAIEVALVYGLGWGVAGSALGTVLAQVLAAALFLWAGWGEGRPRPLRRFPDLAEARLLLSSGGVLVVRTLALLLALDGSTVVAARLGVVRLGGHQIALQVWFLVALSLDALAVPAQILIGQAFGSSDHSQAALIGRRVLRLGVIVGAGLGALTAALAPVLPAVFTADHAVRHQALIGIVFVGVTLPLAAAAFELDGILIGAGDFGYLRFAMLVALAGFAPLAALTWVDHGLGLPGVWGAMGCWLATRALVLARRWRSDLWHPGSVPVADAGAGRVP